MLQNGIEDPAVLAAYGGEEFVIATLYPDVASVTALAEKLNKLVTQKPLMIEGSPHTLSCSIGMACTIVDNNQDPENLILQADKALSEVKRDGGNGYFDIVTGEKNISGAIT